jgi:hypothetical protein
MLPATAIRPPNRARLGPPDQRIAIDEPSGLRSEKDRVPLAVTAVVQPAAVLELEYVQCSDTVARSETMKRPASARMSAASAVGSAASAPKIAARSPRESRIGGHCACSKRERPSPPIR